MGSVYVYLFCCFFFTDTATTEIYTYRHTLSLHDALPIFASSEGGRGWSSAGQADDRRHVLHDALGGVEPDHRSEEHTSELQSLMRISYAVFCLKKQTNNNKQLSTTNKSHPNLYIHN